MAKTVEGRNGISGERKKEAGQERHLRRYKNRGETSRNTVTIGEVMRLDSRTMLPAKTAEQGTDEGTWCGAGKESFIIAQLWNEEVSYGDDTARILKSGLLVGCWLLRVFQAHSASARWSFQGLYFRPERL